MEVYIPQKQNDQHFVAIPFESLLQKLAYKCEDVGIRFVETNEGIESARYILLGLIFPRKRSDGINYS